MSQLVLETLRDEFAVAPDATQLVRIVVRLLVAVALGAVLGYERERRESTAGLRTHMLVALGAVVFVVAPQAAGFDEEQVSRVLQGLIAGIGFLGAGAIIKLSEREQVKGLTTAASIWATAAIAAAVGLGRIWTGIVATALAFGILALLLRLESRINDHHDQEQR
jgi:putative Mg2+ transporter-C (MgtC) family protein